MVVLNWEDLFFFNFENRYEKKSVLLSLRRDILFEVYIEWNSLNSITIDR